MSPGTLANYRGFLVRFGTFQGAHPRAPLETQVRTWLPTLPASRQGSARAALRWHYPNALDWRAIRVAPYRRNVSNLYAGVLRQDARAQLRKAATAPRDRALIECLWVLRRAEAAALRWLDVDLGPGMVSVRHGKGGKASWTLITEDAQLALAFWFDAAGHPPDESPVFPNGAGQHYVPETIGRLVTRLLKKAGLWHRGLGSAHRLRRSFATAYLQSNPGDLEGLRRLLRHERVATTSMYVHLAPEDLAPRLARVRL